MNFRILKKDLTKKKTIHFILMIFIFLATTFIAGSFSNFMFVLNGTEEYMELANAPDYLTGTIGVKRGETSHNDELVQAFLEQEESIDEYTVDNTLWTNSKNYELENGHNLTLNTTTMLCAFDIAQINFFDMDNHKITEMEDGTIYFVRKTMDDNEDLTIGDTIYFVGENDYRKEFIFGGYIKDAFVGSKQMGNHRALVSRGDYEELAKESGLVEGKLYSIWTDDLQGFMNELADESFSTMFGVKQSLLKISYVMDLIIAAVFLIISICLIVVSVLMLRFTIIFTITENYKEIGIMKAIGLTDRAIRMLYVSKYFVISCVGATTGFVASIYVARILIEQVSKNLVVRESGVKIFEQWLVSVVLVVVITFFAYLGTASIKKMTPLDAIRSGSNGERFTKKGAMKLAGKRHTATTFLAWNDVLSDWKKYVVLLLTSLVGIWLVVMPVNTINTLNSDNMMVWCGMQNCDLYIADEESIMNAIARREKKAFEELAENVETLLIENGIEVEKVFSECQLRFKLYHKENVLESMALQGIGSLADKYEYIEGVAPVYENEVALSHLVAESLEAKVGDTIYVLNGGEKQPFVVTAIYQSMLQMGENIRFSETAELDYANCSGTFPLQFVFAEDYEIEEIEQIVKKEYKDAQIIEPKEYLATLIGDIASQLNGMKIYIILVVIFINILVVSLMQKMFLTRERGQIAMLKVMGFDNGAIIKWQMKRIMLVLFVGILLGTLTGTYFSRITAGIVFQFMGLSKIMFEINELEVYVIYPFVLFVTIVVASISSMLGIRKISEREIGDME